MARWNTEPRLVARKLAVQLSATIAESGKRIILVTSTNRGDGKSYLLQLLTPELERIAPYRFRVVSSDEIERLNPWHVPDDRVLLVDGPAMLDGDGFLQIRKGWVSAFDGALVVVMGRRTRREDLSETIDWLHAAKIPPIGIIWNEYVCPRLTARLALFLERLRQPKLWMPRRFRRAVPSRDTTPSR